MDKPYVAYGSNLNAADLESAFVALGYEPSLAAQFVPRHRVWLVDRALRFSAFSKGRNGGVLDVVPAPGCVTPCVLFDVRDARAWEALTRKEGPKYALEDVVVLTESGEPLEAITFAVREPDRMPFVPPSPEYAQVVADGTTAHGLPGTFLERARANGNTHALPLFAYGTLMKGEVRHRTVEGVVTALETGWVKGRLWDCGAFPGMAWDRNGQDVVGELFTLQEGAAVWDALDEEEVFKGHFRADSLFRRIVVPVRTTTQPAVWAWSYVLHHPRPEMPLLEDGDWRAYQRRK